MSEPLSTWLKDILPHVPGVVRSVAKRELILAAREFYRQSGAWREVVQYVDVVDGQLGYSVAPSDDRAEVAFIYSVEWDGRVLPPKSEMPVQRMEAGQPRCWYPTGPATFGLWPMPDMYEEDALTVRVIQTIRADATSLPPIAKVRHYDGILDGVLGRLMSHPAKPYTNPTVGTYHLNRFRNAIAMAAAEVKTGVPSGQNWTFPSYGK
jgi:hypothetical protein